MKVICTLPNASELISGVRFVSHAEGMISEEISDEVGARFLRISGYKAARGKASAPSGAFGEPGETNGAQSVAAGGGDGAGAVAEPPRSAPEPSSPAAPPETNPSPGADELEALRAEAAGLGIKADRRWGAARLKAEIDAVKSKA